MPNIGYPETLCALQYNLYLYFKRESELLINILFIIKKVK